MSSFFEIKESIEQKKYAPVYFFDGLEPYYIDELLDVVEQKILTPEEKDFNLITLYGKDTNWQDVVNAARRFPMFAEKVLVILREASQLKDINNLEQYIKQPSPDTILVIDYRAKDLDKRTAFAKAIKSHAVHFNAAKIKDEEIPYWLINYGKSKGYKIAENVAEMIAVYLGNDLQKITNELEKIIINEPELKELTKELVEKYVGISKEYNPLELPSVLFNGNVKKLGRMLNYFSANPKTAAMPMLIGIFYAYLNKVMLAHYAAPNFANDKKLGIWSHHRQASQRLSLAYVHKLLHLLATYSHKSVGVENSQNDTALLREMCGKMQAVLFAYQ